MKKNPANKSESSNLWRYIIAKVSHEHNRNLLEEFFGTHEIKWRTRICYARSLRDLSNYLNRDFENVTRQNLNRFIAHLKRDGYKTKGGEHRDYKKNSINKKIIGIKAFFSWMEESEYILEDKSPARKLKVRAYTKKPVYLMPSEVERILTAAKKWDNRNYTMISLALHTGLRVGELLSLKLKPAEGQNFINLNTGIIYVNQSKSKEPRSFRIPSWDEDQLENLLKTYIDKNRKAPKRNIDVLFTNKDGRALGYLRFNEILRECGERADLDSLEKFPGLSWENMTPHILRKTFGTSFYRKKKDILKLQAIMGHQDVKTTLVYARLIEGELEEDCEIGLFSTTSKSKPKIKVPETMEMKNEHINPPTEASFYQLKKNGYDPAYV